MMSSPPLRLHHRYDHGGLERSYSNVAGDMTMASKHVVPDADNSGDLKQPGNLINTVTARLRKISSAPRMKKYFSV